MVVAFLFVRPIPVLVPALTVRWWVIVGCGR